MRTKLGRTCRVCKADAWYTRKNGTNECAPCAVRRNSNPKRRRRNNLKARYGLTLTEFEQMTQRQKARCKICGEKEGRLNVDHCHTTGNVRGLLCGNCNRGLGLFYDNATILENAIKYLRSGKA